MAGHAAAGISPRAITTSARPQELTEAQKRALAAEKALMNKAYEEWVAIAAKTARTKAEWLEGALETGKALRETFVAMLQQTIKLRGILYVNPEFAKTELERARAAELQKALKGCFDMLEALCASQDVFTEFCRAPIANPGTIAQFELSIDEPMRTIDGMIHALCKKPESPAPSEEGAGTPGGAGAVGSISEDRDYMYKVYSPGLSHCIGWLRALKRLCGAMKTPLSVSGRRQIYVQIFCEADNAAQEIAALMIPSGSLSLWRDVVLKDSLRIPPPGSGNSNYRIFDF